MQILHRFAGSIQRYSEELSDLDRYRPDHCPQCEAHRPLRAHGFYKRTLVDIAFDGTIRVRRYLCCCCKRTLSLLPEFALRYLRFGIVGEVMRRSGGAHCPTGSAGPYLPSSSDVGVDRLDRRPPVSLCRPPRPPARLAGVSRSGRAHRRAAAGGTVRLNLNTQLLHREDGPVDPISPW